MAFLYFLLVWIGCGFISCLILFLICKSGFLKNEFSFCNWLKYSDLFLIWISGVFGLIAIFLVILVIGIMSIISRLESTKFWNKKISD